MSRKSVKKSHHARKELTEKCPVCAKAFKYQWLLKLHEGVHKSFEERVKYSCHICNAVVLNKRYLKSHVDSHAKIKIVKCRSRLCPSLTFLSKEMETKHYTEEHLTCKLCTRKFSTNAALRIHQVYIHSTDRPFKCGMCDKRFKIRQNLLDHTRIHTNERPFKCPHCRWEFKQKSVLNDHLITHSDAKGFPCQYTECRKVFSSSRLLKVHTKTKHNDKFVKKIYPCPENGCNKIYETTTGLRFHLRKHREEFPHYCLFCDKRFIQKSVCDQHVLRHTTEKSYSCYFCAKRFLTANYDHLRLHTDEKPYKCLLCKKEFSLNAGLQSHKKCRR